MPTITRTTKPIDLEISTKYKTLKFSCIDYLLQSPISFLGLVYQVVGAFIRNDFPKYINSNIHIHLGQYEYTFNYENIKVDHITLMPYIVY